MEHEEEHECISVTAVGLGYREGTSIARSDGQHLLICLEVDTAYAQVIATTSKSWHVFQCLSVCMDSLRGGEGGGRQRE